MCCLIVGNKNTEVFSTESNSFLTAEMLAALLSDVLHDKMAHHDNGCFKNIWDGQTAIRDGQRFELFHFPKHYSMDWFT